MKNRLLLVCVLVLSIFLQACSCDRFDMDTYNSAVKNYTNSIGLDFDITVRTVTEGSNVELLEESQYKYQLTTTRGVKNFASTIKKYEIITTNYGANGDPVKVYELNRYFKEETQKFYINENAVVSNRKVENVTYEEKYDTSSIYHLNNIVPVFTKENMANFKIVKDDSKKGYSIATFDAVCPTAFECGSEIINYTVTMDKDFYFSKIEFAVVNGNKTSSYTYKFNKYNSYVEIVFPNNLNSY